MANSIRWRPVHTVTTAPTARPLDVLPEGSRHVETASFDLRRIVTHNWMLIVACALLSATAAPLMARMLPKVYEATASLRIDERQLSLPALDVLESNTSRNDVGTELEALKSRALAEGVADSLGLRVVVSDPASEPRTRLLAAVKASPTGGAGRYRLRVLDQGVVLDSGASHTVLRRFAPGARIELGDASFVLTPRARDLGEIELETLSLLDATDAMREDLLIDRPVRDANILTVRYRSSDPELARAVPNAIVGRFIAQRQSVRQREAATTASFLREQVARISTQLHAAEDSLRRFREGRRVIDPEEEGRVGLSHLGDLRAQRDQLESERASLSQVMRDVDVRALDARAKAGAGSVPGDGSVASAYRNLVAFPSLLRNQATSELLTSLNTVEDRRSELRARRSDRDPEVMQLTARVREIEDQLHSMTATYLSGLTKQIASLNSSLSASNGELARLPSKEVEFARLGRQTKLLGDMSNLLQTRLKEAEIAVASQDATVHLVDTAVLPRRAVSPKPLVVFLASLTAGLLLGVAVGTVRQRIDRSVHSRNDVIAVTGGPVLGMIPHVPLDAMHLRASIVAPAPAAVRAGAPALSDAEAPGALPAGDDDTVARRPRLAATTQQTLIEAFNRLEANVAFADRATPVSTLVITSPMPGEGKTSIAINLAIMSALRGRRVLLVDADMRRGTLDAVFQSPRSPGLADVIGQRASLEDALRVVDLAPGRSLHILTAGTPPQNAAQLLTPATVRYLLDSLSQRYDFVVLDTPPVNVVNDAALLGAGSDGVLVVARAGVTTTPALVLAAEQFEHVRAPVVGAVLNDIPRGAEVAGDAAYAYYASAAANDPPATPASPTPS